MVSGTDWIPPPVNWIPTLIVSLGLCSSKSFSRQGFFVPFHQHTSILPFDFLNTHTYTHTHTHTHTHTPTFIHFGFHKHWLSSLSQLHAFPGCTFPFQDHKHLPHTNDSHIHVSNQDCPGEPGWLSQLSVRLLNSAQVLISEPTLGPVLDVKPIKKKKIVLLTS